MNNRIDKDGVLCPILVERRDEYKERNIKHKIFPSFIRMLIKNVTR